MKSIGLYFGVMLLLAVSAGKAFSQYIDTACIGETHAMYRTGERAGSVFFWTVEGGTIDSTSTDGSKIWVNWGMTGGIKKITVIERTKEGCPGKPVDALVLLWPTEPVNIFGPEQVCKGTDVVLEAKGNADLYVWNTGDTGERITVKPDFDTSFVVTGYFGECGNNSSLHDMRVKYKPQADFSFAPTQPIIYEDVNFTYTGTNNVDFWNWEFMENGLTIGSSEIMHPTHSFTQAGVKAVRLTVRNSFGCTDSITKYIIVESGINVFIPTGFTPNGDGFNNVFKPVYENVLRTEFTVLDRWGEVMFKTTSLEEGWDGRYKGAAVPDGVFVYLVQVTGKDNKNYVFNGTVTVLR
ncbi:gliding motility-associated C-terminal domain-containing protein [Oscillatoria amoena NRMC-F 0135]|nr:gliding motility-associated C-terminal domain-containing protein [Oscillatoria amoena NRMC-F 0135]